jgi:hypothetical protein
MTAPARSGPLAHLEVLDMSRMYPGAFTDDEIAALRAGTVVG